MKQSILEQSLVAQYPIGLRYKEPGPMGRTFHYCKAAADIPAIFWGVANLNGLHEGASHGAVSAGGKTITVADATGTLDQYKDGFLTIFTTITQVLRIKSNTVTLGGYVTLTLKDPLLYDVADATDCGWYPNIYGNVANSPGTGFYTFVCVNLIPVTLGYHFWGETYGFCHGIPYGDPFGLIANERDLYFHTDGALMSALQATVGTISKQRAGYLLPFTTVGGGDQAYMLQLAP